MERTQIGLLLAKAETTYGTDPTPSSASNVIAVARGQVTIDQQAESINRNILDGGYGRVNGINALPMTNLRFRTELRGNRVAGASNSDISSGEAANAIEIHPLLLGCDLAATYVAESSDGARDGFVYYQPTIPTDAGTGVTFWFYSEGKLYKVTGGKGNIENIGIEAGKFGFIDWSFSGMYNAVTDSSIPASPTFLDTKPPAMQLPASWSAQAVTLDGTANTVGLNSHGLPNGYRVKLA